MLLIVPIAMQHSEKLGHLIHRVNSGGHAVTSTESEMMGHHAARFLSDRI
jgi:hypothetical protein